MAEIIGKRQRRKSLSVFSPSLTISTSLRPPLHDRTPSDDTLTRDKKSRRNSSFFGRSHSPNRGSDGSNSRRPGTAGSDTTGRSPSTPVIETPRPRRKSLQKKRTSVFGSLRSLHSWEDDEPITASIDSVADEQTMASPRNGIWSSAILHHGEVQTTGGMWRKKSQYLVLTDTHLIRFKNQSKATDIFGSIPASYTRTPASHRQSVASVSSLQDMQLMATADSSAGIPLNSIIAVYMLEDARLSPSVEVAYLDERTHKATLVQMQTSDLQELNLWMVGIRQAAQMARANFPMLFSRGSIEYVTRMLEHERDYDPEVFRMFRVIQIASSKSITRSSSDDLTKLSPTGCYLAIGAHKLHLLPMQKTTNRSSVVSLSDWESGTSFGLMNLTSLSMEYGDDSLHLTFRVPLKKSFNVFLASVHSVEVACWIRQHTEYLRPLWIRQPYEFVVPKELQNDDNFPPVALDEDYGCFDRTLVAYSASYDIDTSNIRYTIDQECEDAPCFRLLKPASPKTPRYTALELIAVMRALRYNEFFQSISFRGVNLDALQGLRDVHGVDPDVHLDRGGSSVHIPGQENLAVLSQEVRALTLKSKWLRRLDFSYCLTRIPIPTLDKGTRDPGCGIPEAIFPVCRRELTSVDWVVLNGIKLGESDLDYLVDAASQRRSHLRALEVGDCGLSVHDLDLLLSTIIAQESTLEAINISGVQGRLNPDVLQQYIGYFGQIRKINLSRISRTSGTDPLITAEMLFNWRLEELALSRTALNRETVDAIATYLASDRSSNLRVIRLDQCGLTGEDVAMFMHSMSVGPDAPRSLHLHVNENRLDNGCSHIFNAIAKNQTPSHLSMRMIDFKKEDHFRQMVDSLRKNSTLKFLDISKASLPYDASPETCRSLQVMLEENETLEALDISGENAHLDVARFGIGLNLALTGLKKNKSLKVLRIEHQKLGLQGANTLASVLEENDSLREVHCENNDINLQSFTVLVNGLRYNRSLLTLSCVNRDRTLSLDKVRREVDSVRWESSNSNQNSTANSVRRSLYAAMSVGQGGQGHRLSKAPPPSVASALENSPFANHNVELVMRSLNERWDTEVARLNRYLRRNYNIAHGIEEIDDDAASDGRPGTAVSLGTMLDNLKFDVSVSADEIRASSLPDESPAAIRLSETSDTPSQPSNIESTSIQPKRLPSDTRRPHTALPAQFAPSSHGSSTPTSRLAIPVPAVPPAVRKAESVRSAHSSSSNASIGAGSTRSAYGVASSTLRGFLSGTALRERRRADAVRPSHVYVNSDKPPQLDWAPPKVDLGELQ
ncbi:Leucine-rich repeat ribonuclease inhibitor subtype [Penicillium cf. griseofulvum]|uniref:Leucine-rich repeat ribonuclease inhibitor subtype n=1 Tax=Penicillium cf. griseofulvum TaxID=2972120 RepID=A0A9W9MQC2_9EURO|nr:Leucine-rich repeat ribonuclease inhibitor subtype [Penicillium cf. griseofulvum]KAJ5441443.1 Leucine-rich repeat ribonuclease inhibitor subtype [Penicillium cf. griseofulvum]